MEEINQDLIKSLILVFIRLDGSLNFSILDSKNDIEKFLEGKFEVDKGIDGVYDIDPTNVSSMILKADGSVGDYPFYPAPWKNGCYLVFPNIFYGADYYYDYSIELFKNYRNNGIDNVASYFSIEFELCLLDDKYEALTQKDKKHFSFLELLRIYLNQLEIKNTISYEEKSNKLIVKLSKYYDFSRFLVHSYLFKITANQVGCELGVICSFSPYPTESIGGFGCKLDIGFDTYENALYFSKLIYNNLDDLSIITNNTFCSYKRLKNDPLIFHKVICTDHPLSSAIYLNKSKKSVCLNFLDNNTNLFLFFAFLSKKMIENEEDDLSDTSVEYFDFFGCDDPFDLFLNPSKVSIFKDFLLCYNSYSWYKEYIYEQLEHMCNHDLTDGYKRNMINLY